MFYNKNSPTKKNSEKIKNPYLIDMKESIFDRYLETLEMSIKKTEDFDKFINFIENKNKKKDLIFRIGLENFYSKNISERYNFSLTFDSMINKDSLIISKRLEIANKKIISFSPEKNNNFSIKNLKSINSLNNEDKISKNENNNFSILLLNLSKFFFQKHRKKFSKSNFTLNCSKESIYQNQNNLNKSNKKIRSYNKKILKSDNSYFDSNSTYNCASEFLDLESSSNNNRISNFLKTPEEFKYKKNVEKFKKTKKDRENSIRVKYDNFNSLFITNSILRELISPKNLNNNNNDYKNLREETFKSKKINKQIKRDYIIEKKENFSIYKIEENLKSISKIEINKDGKEKKSKFFFNFLIIFFIIIITIFIFMNLNNFLAKINKFKIEKENKFKDKNNKIILFKNENLYYEIGDLKEKLNQIQIYEESFEDKEIKYPKLFKKIYK